MGGGPNFRAFFPSPATIFVLSLSQGVFSWNFGGVRSAGGLKCARLGSRVVV